MEFNPKKIKAKVLTKYPFLGIILANGKIEETTRSVRGHRTAYADGYDLYYFKEFMDGLTEDEQVFVVAHEAMHNAFKHIQRGKSKIPEMWNVATDAVINAQLKFDGLSMPKNLVDLPWAKDFDAESLYEVFMENKELWDQVKKELLEKMRELMGDQNENQDGDGSLPDEIIIDGHDFWYDDNEDEKENGSSSSGGSPKSKDDNQSDSNGNSSGNGESKDSEEKDKEDKDGSGNSEDAAKKKKEMLRKKRLDYEKDAISKEGEKETFKKNNEQKEKELKDMRRKLIDTQFSSHNAGTEAGNMLRNVANIGIAKPLLEWRRILRENNTYELDWSYQNATVEDGILRAQLEKQPISEIEIVLDTSGSIGEELLKTFLRECKNISTQARIKIGCFDTQFYGWHQIRRLDDIDKIPYEGGGGTDFDVAVSAFTRRVPNRILFTDGYADLPKDPPSIIWVVIGDNKIQPKNSKVIYISEEELAKRMRRK